MKIIPYGNLEQYKGTEDQTTRVAMYNYVGKRKGHLNF